MMMIMIELGWWLGLCYRFILNQIFLVIGQFCHIDQKNQHSNQWNKRITKLIHSAINTHTQTFVDTGYIKKKKSCFPVMVSKIIGSCINIDNGLWLHLVYSFNMDGNLVVEVHIVAYNHWQQHNHHHHRHHRNHRRNHHHVHNHRYY